MQIAKLAEGRYQGPDYFSQPWTGRAGPRGKRPNDPSSATRPTRAFDCNLDAMAEFAAAHG